MIIIQLIGGFSNHLFQYATARAIALRNNDIVKIDKTNFENNKSIYRLDKINIYEDIASNTEISLLKNAPRKNLLAKIINKTNFRTKYNKRSHYIENCDNSVGFDYRILTLKGDIFLQGWLANENYFLDVRPTIIREFTLKDEIDNVNKSLLQEIQETNSVSIHFRRGEYLTHSFFGILKLDYYYNAISEICQKIDNPRFYIFSDDPSWVAKNFKISKNHVIVKNNSQTETFFNTRFDYIDLMLMKACKHNIIANSTFSWWAAWLNKNTNKIVIAPKIWFKDTKAQKSYNNGSFIPSAWIKI